MQPFDASLCVGCGLPPGPGGSLGAAEGVSYVAVAVVALWSLISRISARGKPSAGILDCQKACCPQRCHYPYAEHNAVVLVCHYMFDMQWALTSCAAEGFTTMGVIWCQRPSADMSRADAAELTASTACSSLLQDC